MPQTSTQTTPTTTPRPGHPAPDLSNLPLDADRMTEFGNALDKVRRDIEAKIGDEDLAYVQSMQRRSDVLQWIGRGLIHFSFEPVGFSAGVISLWLHKQLEATEIGHTALHGAFDKIDGAERWHSETYKWRIPIDEPSWHRGHNQAHHQYTNIAGKDPDIHFGPVRLTEHTPHNTGHRFQLFYTLLFLFPNFAALMNMHFTGMVDVFQGNGRPEKFDFIEKRSLATVRDASWRAMRKFVPYYGKEYVLFPLLAGPFFWKVLLGNWLSEVMRDVYSAATILCGHVGDDVANYAEGTRAHGRGQWYAMQVGSANNFDVPLPVSQLCGALDLQIEHHLFPRFPTNRLREAAPQVQAICEEYGIEYKKESWPRTLRKALKHVAELSREQPNANLFGRVGHVLDAMA